MFRRRILSVLVSVALFAGMGGLIVDVTAARAATAPSFTNYAPPLPPAGQNRLGTDAGEPSIGVDRATGKVMYQAGFETLQVTVAGGTATWKDVSPALTSVVSLDPILFTDPGTGRTFVSQLDGACSLMAYTDTDGEPTLAGQTNSGWVQNPIGCGAGTLADHQTVGGGAYAPPLTGTPLYRDSAYYCAQAGAGALCARSDDGGLTFGPGVPMYTAVDCGGLHGHLKAAPDGTVYVPNAACSAISTKTLLAQDRQGVAYSTNNGVTWKVSVVPDSSTQQESDPSVAVGAGGTVYFGYADGSGTPKVAVGHKDATGALSWSPSKSVNPNIKNTQFPTMVAGDDGRAAIAYLGTTTAGDDQADRFTGVWHLYVSTTYDGGATWTTTDATPSDPVQRGCIYLGGFGGSSSCRNLLDFMDATLDATGHIVVGYADGCTETCVNGGKNTYSALATIAYQSGGDPLFAGVTASSTSSTSSTTSTQQQTIGAPTLTARSATGKQPGVKLSWTAPTSSSTITGYEVRRGTTAGGESSTPIAAVSGSTLSYADKATTSGTTYYYKVRAVAGSAIGPDSNEASARAA